MKKTHLSVAAQAGAARPEAADEAVLPKDRRKDRLIRLPAVISRTGLSEATIFRRERKGTFPKREYISPRMVAWYESDIDDFVASPLAYRRPPERNLDG